MRWDENGVMPRVVAMAMDLTPYLKELKGKRVLCDEYTYEAASMCHRRLFLLVYEEICDILYL